MARKGFEAIFAVVANIGFVQMTHYIETRRASFVDFDVILC
jgi:hypothetical protein